MLQSTPVYITFFVQGRNSISAVYRYSVKIEFSMTEVTGSDFILC
ncbi:hypothetical protein yinte0001_2920 [Yersinia intermedia ATCC 29909]|nr:hypothetical protein yinte0001_2920 [Yersinia intermedia ATCC 29909]